MDQVNHAPLPTDIIDTNKRCLSCKRYLPPSQFTNLRNPSMLTLRCLPCREGSATVEKRTHHAAELSPEKRSASRPRSLLPVSGPLQLRSSTILPPRNLPSTLMSTPALPLSPQILATSSQPGRNLGPVRNQEILFLRRGQNSQDDCDTAAARREMVTIRRAHRLDRRQGRDPSPTPNLLEPIASSNCVSSFLTPATPAESISTPVIAAASTSVFAFMSDNPPASATACGDANDPLPAAALESSPPITHTSLLTNVLPPAPPPPLLTPHLSFSNN